MSYKGEAIPGRSEQEREQSKRGQINTSIAPSTLDLCIIQVLVWFDAALNDPKTVIPDGKLPHFKASSFDSRWIGKYVAVRGTVTRVDLDTDRRPFYATIHFKESSNNGIMGFSPNSSMLQSKYGKDFSGLVGRPVEIWGYVGNWREGAGVRILDLSQVSLVDSGFSAADADSKPDWLTANLPREVLVDSPKYLAWKKFSPAAKATYIEYSLSERGPLTDQYSRKDIARFTLSLESIDDKRAVVRSALTVWRMADNGKPSYPPATQLIFKAKVAPQELPAVAPNESGDETLEINGRKIATHWQSVWELATTVSTTLDPQTFTKTWTSDEVPGGLVQSHKQSHQDIGGAGKTYRSISRTTLESFAGVTPGSGGLNTSQQTPNPAAAPPAGPDREVPARETPSQPISRQPPPLSVRDSDRAIHAQPAAAVPASAGGSPAMRDLSLRYADLVRRSAQAKAGAAQIERQLARQRLGLPIDVVNARSRMDTQLRTAREFIGRGDADQAEQSLQYAEAALGILEKFLSR